MRYENKTFITLTGTKLGETEKAVKFSILQINGMPVDLAPKDKTQWFPFSQLKKMTSDPASAGQDVIVVSEWICEQKNLLTAVEIASSRPANIDEHGFDKLDQVDQIHDPEDPDSDVPF